MSFEVKFRDFIETAEGACDENFSIETVKRIANILGFLYQDWFKVETNAFDRLPKTGPALIVANAGGIMPWAGVMMMYALMTDKSKTRRLHIMADLDWIEDERVYSFARELGFVSFNADNARKLFSEGRTVMVFPEGQAGFLKPFGERYRVRNFDWTMLLTAVEMKVPMVPLAVVGPDESFPMHRNVEWLAKLLSLPAFPITPFFPLLPFPANLLSVPVKWKMRMLKVCDVDAGSDRHEIEEAAKRQALFLEGEIQAELNRVLRTRIKPLF